MDEIISARQKYLAFTREYNPLRTHVVILIYTEWAEIIVFD